MLYVFIIYELRMLFAKNLLQFILTNVLTLMASGTEILQEQNRLKGNTTISITLLTYSKSFDSDHFIFHNSLSRKIQRD